MLSKKTSLSRPHESKRKLKRFSLLFFVLLALPLYFLIHRAYRQLEIESFSNQRDLAEELAEEMDLRFQYMIERENLRTFEAYRYLDVSQGKPQVSELASMPSDQLVKGLISYFQITHEGHFISPLLPEESDRSHSLVKLTEADYLEREEVVDRCFEILTNNQFQNTWGQSEQPLVNNYQRMFESKDQFGSSLGKQVVSDMLEDRRNRTKQREIRDEDKLEEMEEIDLEKTILKKEVVREAAPQMKSVVKSKKTQKLSDLKFDNSLQVQAEVPQASISKRNLSFNQQSRQSALNLYVADKNELEEEVVQEFQALSEAPKRTILSFAGEVDPFRVEVLDSGEFVFFRSVWRGGQRTIQGFLIDSSKFLDQMLREPLGNHRLKDWVRLVAGLNGSVIYTAGIESTDDKSIFLLKHYVTSPFQNLELIFSLPELPPHSGTTLLNALVIVFLSILCFGLLGIYRIGIQQINLAQQHHDFVASVSHELKTPLTSIRMYGEMLRSNWVDDEKKKTYYDFIFFESERLSRLINNVLQLSKLSNPKEALELSNHSAEQLLDLVQSKISTQVEAAGFELKMMRDTSDEVKAILANEDAFSQIMINLVDNALKFSKEFEPKLLEVGYKTTSEGLYFYVSDYGPGISKAQEQKIFDLFYRVEDELTRKTQGTGIGLALVSELASQMKAKLVLHRKEQGLEVRCCFKIS